MVRWLEAMAARPAVARGMALALEKRQALQKDREAMRGMFKDAKT
jgi:GST-like protein